MATGPISTIFNHTWDLVMMVLVGRYGWYVECVAKSERISGRRKRQKMMGEMVDREYKARLG